MCGAERCALRKARTRETRAVLGGMWRALLVYVASCELDGMYCARGVRLCAEFMVQLVRSSDLSAKNRNNLDQCALFDQ